MKVFEFDPADYRADFEREGWVHIPGGISQDFLGALREFVERSLGDHHVEGTAIAGSKDQALFEFPDGVDYPGEVFDAIASMCNLNRPTMTLSERHVKAYYDDTPAEQLPHKDRFASQVSVGLSISIPAESRLVLYPHDHVSVNPYNISGALPSSLPPDGRPEAIAASAQEVEIDDADGDVIAFRGSAVWHCRRRAAGAVNLYLKLNDFGSDPLGEDPETARRREATMAVLVSGNGDLDSLVPVLSRRLDHVSSVYLRDTWEEVLQAQVFDQTPLQLTQEDVELLRSLDGQQQVGDLVALFSDRERGKERLRHLAESEVIDLLSAPA